jgi:hypothetical protein
MNVQALQDAKKAVQGMCNVVLGEGLNDNYVINQLQKAIPRNESDRRITYVAQQQVM